MLVVKPIKPYILATFVTFIKNKCQGTTQQPAKE